MDEVTPPALPGRKQANLLSKFLSRYFGRFCTSPSSLLGGLALTAFSEGWWGSEAHLFYELASLFTSFPARVGTVGYLIRQDRYSTHHSGQRLLHPLL